MSESDRPNIVLITTDQQRYDTLGVTTGEEWIQTPNLDALADRGMLLERTYVQNPVCMPSRASLQTGRYPHQHGLDHMKTEIDTSPGLPDWELTFMERLQIAGYRTGGAGKLHMMPHKGLDYERLSNGKGTRWTEFEGSDLGRGPLGPTYAQWLERRHPGGYQQIYEQRKEDAYSEYRTAITNILPKEEYIDYWVTDQAIEFLHDPHSTPSFLWCGFMSPHGPVDPPEPYDQLYDPEDVGMPNQRDDVTSPTSPKGSSSPWWGDDAEKILRWRRHYWGLVSLIDEMVGRLMEALEARGMLENTLIIFTSDHGEGAGDYGLMGKGNFYEESIRVPTIVCPPGGTDRDRLADLVELTDLTPTILDYAGIEIPSQLVGESLRPVLEGRQESFDREAIFSARYIERDVVRHSACLRTDDYKFVYHGPTEQNEFYDLVDDPEELFNRIDDPAYREQISYHKDVLIDKILRGGEHYYQDQTPSPRDLQSWLN